MTEPFVSGLVGWLVQEAGRASVRRFSDRVSRALERVIRDAVRRAATRVCADDEQRKRTVALLLERRAMDLPMVDGTPMTHLDLAVREWVASIEHPVGEDGRLSAIGDHPLVDALRDEILEGIRDEATRGDGVLHPLWDDYVATSNQQELLAAIAGVINTLLSTQEQIDRDALFLTPEQGRRRCADQ